MYCHKRNHTENVCRKKRADTANSNRSDSTTSNAQSTSERSGTSSNRNSNSYGRSSSGPPAMFGSTPQLSMVVSKVSVALHSFASTPSPEWILDPGASNHYCNNADWFSDLRPDDGTVQLANGGFMKIFGRGTIVLAMNTPTGTFSVKLSDVHFIPNLQFNLFSLSRVTDLGFTVAFSGDVCHIKRNNDVFAQGSKRGSIFYLDTVTALQPTRTPSIEVTSTQIALAAKVDANTWHARLGHVSVQHTAKTKKYTTGMDLDNCKHEFCASCLAGMQSQLPFPQRSFSKTSAPLKLIHSDVCGPMQDLSLSGHARYFLTFTDDFSRYGFVVFLKQKLDTLQCFKDFNAYCNTQFG
ncbi:hypothetical protein LEN26_001248 [Aphanomyces euteiches]|nr:hypothetical protein LEN26_001248 [Aphanomyces euteiches]